MKASSATKFAQISQLAANAASRQSLDEASSSITIPGENTVALYVGWAHAQPGLRCKGATASLLRMASGESRRTQFLRGVLDLCLLAVMEEGPAYGYEMTKRLRARGLSIVGEGSIYPLLGRLEREGLVETYRAASDGGPPRKYYRPSGDGRRALAAGVSEWRAARDAVDAVLSVVEAEVEP
jgi:PadR family transcriptional regulator PadR